MQLGLSARDRRTLVVGVTAVGSLFSLGRGVPALLAWQAAQRLEAATVTSELAAARRGARIAPLLRDSLRVRIARLAIVDSLMLRGATPSAAAADLASTLDQLADGAEVKVSAMQLHADSVGIGSVAQVAVRLTATADVYGLLALLRAIEGGDALLAVRELNVSQPEPTAPATKPEMLRLDLLVVGLVRMTGERK